jgi:hypothetical protein
VTAMMGEKHAPSAALAEVLLPWLDDGARSA